MTAASESAPFAAHSDSIDDILAGVLRGKDGYEVATETYLNGRASSDARALLPLAFRRRVGAFFTSSPIRAEVSAILGRLPGTTYLDPTCGAGDLLLTAAEQLPIQGNLFATLSSWNRSLQGWDLHDEFVRAARRRLALYAASRHIAEQGRVRSSIRDFDRVLTSIETGDALARLKAGEGKRADVVVLNPPYTRVSAPPGSTWTGGRTSAAAVFLLESLGYLNAGGHLIAILPDSLRSGSNFERWRSVVEAQADVLEVRKFGLFDDHADVDVFLLVLRARGYGPPRTMTSWWRNTDADLRVEDKFLVRVGTVVDNRDPKEGPPTPFLTARDLPAHSDMSVPSRRREFAGRLYKPPFVAVRRTSRPSAEGETRIRGVLVTGTVPIAVDNHLLVLEPRQGGISACRQLIGVLASGEITEILNERIRCRHLTVRVLKELPWQD